MAITAAEVKELRERTGIPMMKCKKALEECDGDMDAAVEHLRKQGLAAADKKSDRATNAGGIGVAIDGGKGVMVFLACETDFVSGNELFKEFVTKIAESALANGIESLDALKESTLDGAPMSEAIGGMVAKLGENLQLEGFELVSGDAVAGYNHGGRVATLVAGSGDAAVLRQAAMHVAAVAPAPIALTRDEVPAATLEKEREIIAASDEIQAKPEQIRPKIIEGKLNRFYKENVLLDQEMLGDPDFESGSVEKWAKSKGVTITAFSRIG